MPFYLLFAEVDAVIVEIILNIVPVAIPIPTKLIKYLCKPFSKRSSPIAFQVGWHSTTSKHGRT